MDRSLPSRCPQCGRYQQAWSTTRISVAEMERYYHLLGVCQEAAVLKSMYEPLKCLYLQSSDASRLP